MLHTQTVNEETLALIKKLSADNKLLSFILGGGTALALQLGHRKSTDAGLFTRQAIDVPAMAKHLESSYGAAITSIAPNGVLAKVGEVKIGLLSNHRNMIAPIITSDGIRMASLDDIGAMKMHAILNTGQQTRDFADLYYLLEHRSLDALTRAYAMKYPEGKVNLARQALLYYEGIDHKNIPEMLLRPFNLNEIKIRMAMAVAKPGEVFRRTVRRGKKLEGDENLNVAKKIRRGKSL